MLKKSLLFLLAFAAGTLWAVEYKDTPKELIVTVDGHTFAINKKTAPSWGSNYTLTIDNSKDLRLSAYAGIADPAFGGKGIGQMVSSKTAPSVTIFKEDKNSLTVRAEYAITQVGKKNPDYTGIKMVWYYTFTDGIPGTAVNIRILARDRGASVTALNANFGSKFTHYTGKDGKRIEYPAKSWSSIPGGFVVAEKGDIKIAVSAKTRNPSRGFAWVNSRKSTIDLDQFTETRGYIGFVKDDADVKKLQDFFNSVAIPAEAKKVVPAGTIDFRESNTAAIVTLDGHTFAINKKTEPEWGRQYSLTIDGNKNLRLTTNTGIEDEIFTPNGIGQLIPSGTPVKVSVVEKTSRTLTVRAEYGICRVGKKEPDFAGAKMVYYYSFTAGVPGVAVNIRLVATDRNVTVRALNSNFGANFTHYTNAAGKRIAYPNEKWSSIRSEYVIAEQKDIKIALNVKTHIPAKGFSWVGPANQWRKILIKPGEFVESRGFIGFVNDKNDVEKLKNFFNSIQIPEEKQKSNSQNEMVASPVTAGKDGWPVKWPAPSVVRKGSGWVRPDTTDTWGGDDNLSFNAAFGFDPNYFYIRADVTDSFFRQTGTADKIWAGDCMQVAFDPLNEKTVSKNLILLGFTVTEKPSSWCWDHPDKKYTATDVSKYCKIRGTHRKGGYVYEVAIPWEMLKPFSVDRAKMGFNIVMLDDDGVGPRHWMGITDGIAGGKNPALYQPLYFTNPEKVLLAGMKDPTPLLRMDSDTTVGEEPLNFSVAQMLPEKLAGATLTVTAGKKVWKEKLNVGFNSFQYTIAPKELVAGKLDISAVISGKDGKELYRITKSTRIVTRAGVEELCKETEAAADKLKAAVKKLEKHGKNTAYFTNRLALADYFIRMVRLDNSKDVIFRAPATRVKKQMTPVTPEYRRWIYRRSVRNLNYCIEMLNNGVTEADAILAGKAPDRKVAPMPIAAKMEIKNGGFTLNGKEMFFLGPNTWQIHYTQLKDIAGAGMNLFDVTGLGRRNTTVPITPVDEEYVHEKLDNRFNPNVLLKSRDMGLYFFARQFAGCSYVQNLDTPDHYKKTAASDHEVWRFEADQPHLIYLISHLESFTHEKNMPRFEKNMAAHLEKKYTTVDAANKVLGTSYRSFSDFKESDRANPAVRYEIFLFEKEANFKALKESNKMKREFWKQPTTTHISTSHWTAWDTLRNCADFEALYEECDIAGYDAGVRLESRYYAASWEAVMMLCDFSRSLFPEKPVTNNETHNFPINCSYDVDKQFIYTAQISEMLHGRNAGVMWKWEKDFHDPWGSYAFTRADSFHSASIAALDARRLADEIAAFRREKRQFGIFYSLPSFCDVNNYKKINDLYQGSYFHGIAPGFITEKTLLQGKFADYKVILVPDARRVSDEVFAALMKRAEQGVKVIRFGEKSLTMDEYGHVKSDRVKALAKLPLFKISDPQSYFPILAKIFADNGIKAACDVTGTDGKKLWALEYRSTADGKLLYVINWNKQPLTVKLPKGEWKELFSESDAPQQMTLKPLDIKLFKRKK
ncbi:MAG: hypothetical protein E7058_01730 [Lentisphaerae bacterium]|nr:hypothetical protein [Lentisphaerota bacterium]